jgi:hypothetical protein
MLDPLLNHPIVNIPSDKYGGENVEYNLDHAGASGLFSSQT